MAARLAPVNWGLAVSFAGLSVIVGLLAGVNPKLAIVASLAIGLVFVVLADLTAGLAAFALLSFLDLLNAGSIVSVGKMAGALLALGWLAVLVTRNDARSDFMAVHPGMTMVLGVFMGWIALSALWAEDTSVVISSFTRFLPNVILFLIVFTAVRNVRHASWIAAGFIAGSVAAGAYGLFFGGAVLQEQFGGRLAGGNLDPNELASFLVAAVALSIGVAATLKGKPGLRLAVAGAAGFCLVAAVMTGSRGGLVALSVTLVAAIVFGGRWRGRIALASAMIALVTVLYIATAAPEQVRERIESTTQGQSRVVEGRTTLWQIGERMVRANPVQGVGAGNFQVSSRHYLLQPGAVYRSDVIVFEPQVAHNTYLQITAELGLVGLALFGSIVAFSVGSALRGAKNFAARGDTAGEAMSRALVLALIGVLAADFFLSQEVSKQLWLLLGLGPAILAASRGADGERPRTAAAARA